MITETPSFVFTCDFLTQGSFSSKGTRGPKWPTGVIKKHLSEVKFSERKTKLEQKNKAVRKKTLPFVTQYHPRKFWWENVNDAV